MTRERRIEKETAINELEMLKEDACDELQEMAIDMAIEALRQERLDGHHINAIIIDESERPKGRWERNEHDKIVCSNCKNEPLLDDFGFWSMSNFCPNCGVDNRGEEECIELKQMLI